MNDDEKRFLEQIQKQNEDAHAETRRQVQATAAELRQRFDKSVEANRRDLTAAVKKMRIQL
jgi:hypothetical protein